MIDQLLNNKFFVILLISLVIVGIIVMSWVYRMLNTMKKIDSQLKKNDKEELDLYGNPYEKNF